MEELKTLLKSLREKYIFIPIFVLLSLIAIVYGYCFVAEHEILSIKQKSSNERYEYTMTAVCKPTGAFTSTPYVTVKLNGLELLETSVHQGYDFITDCLSSSVKDIQLFETEKKVKIYMKDGQVKEINILGL